MANRVNLQMQSTAPNGDPITKSITYANSDHSSQTGTTWTEMEDGVKALNNLTKNTYVETVVIQREPLSELVAAEEEG